MKIKKKIILLNIENFFYRRNNLYLECSKFSYYLNHTNKDSERFNNYINNKINIDNIIDIFDIKKLLLVCYA